MFTFDALSILRKADGRFTFGREDLDVARARSIPLAVWFDGRPVGHLHHNEMPDRKAVVECFGHYGLLWNKEREREGYRPAWRESWRRCFTGIMGQVPDRVAERVKHYLRKAGFRL